MTPQPPRLTTAEVAHLLGVKPATVYAYVSRGLLGSHRNADGKGSLFDRADVDAFLAARRRTTTPGIQTGITLIQDGALYYRGHDAVQLARVASFEEVVHLLWTGSRAFVEFVPDDAQRRLARAVITPLPRAARHTDRLRVIVAAAAAADPLRFDTSPAAVTSTGRTLLATMVSALPHAARRVNAISADTGDERTNSARERSRVDRAPSGDATRATSDPVRALGAQTRATGERTRATADVTRAASDATRVTADAAGTASDATRATADATRVPSDATRATADATRASSDATKATADATRALSDATRATAEATGTASDAMWGASEANSAAGDGRRLPRTAEVLWPRLTRREPTPKDHNLLDAALILLADHDIAASTLAARVAASTRAHPYAVVGAGLAALDGPLHGAASSFAHPLLAEAMNRPDPIGAVADKLRSGDPVPGFGHHLYPDGDPRAAALLDMLGDTRAREAAERVAHVMLTRSGLRPNVDLALAALTLEHAMPADAGETIFAIARTAGWIAHALEEYADRPSRFRPSGEYAGPPGKRASTRTSETRAYQ